MSVKTPKKRNHIYAYDRHNDNHKKMIRHFLMITITFVIMPIS